MMLLFALWTFAVGGVIGFSVGHAYGCTKYEGIGDADEYKAGGTSVDD